MAKKRMSALQKQRRRIQQYIRRGERNKGLRWSENFKESLKGKSARQLRNITPEKLLKQATGLSPKTGEIVSGLEVQRERRSMSAKKGWETRRIKREYKEFVNQGELIMGKLDDIVTANYGKFGATFLSNLIQKEISTYGYTKFVRALGVLDESVVYEATELAQYESRDVDKAKNQYNKLVNMIRGAMPTESEAKEVGNVMDNFDTGEEEIYE